MELDADPPKRSGMLNQASSGVLASFRPSTYPFGKKLLRQLGRVGEEWYASGFASPAALLKTRLNSL